MSLFQPAAEPRLNSLRPPNSQIVSRTGSRRMAVSERGLGADEMTVSCHWRFLYVEVKDSENWPKLEAPPKRTSSCRAVSYMTAAPLMRDVRECSSFVQMVPSHSHDSSRLGVVATVQMPPVVMSRSLCTWYSSAPSLTQPGSGSAGTAFHAEVSVSHTCIRVLSSLLMPRRTV